MLMNILYLIRTQGCPTCGMSTKISAGSSAASRHGYSFINVKNDSAEVAELMKEWDGINETLNGKNCIFFNANNGRATDCSNLSSSHIDTLFGDE